MSDDRTWDKSENEATDRSVFSRRRQIVTMLGLGAGGAALATGAAWWYRGSDNAVLQAGRSAERETAEKPFVYQATSEQELALGRTPTPLPNVARYVNFYEFSPFKFGTWRLAQELPLESWKVRVDGLVSRPRTFDVDDLSRQFGVEQRTYKHRCVETWAMVVPWCGFAFKKLMDHVQPLDSAKYVRFVTANVQSLIGTSADARFQWPYQEALTIKEAANELTFLATGYYGERLFKQNGAPIRLVVPWKYGFKSAKSLVHIEFTDKKPWTFWNSASPDEYGFTANVNPHVDHPRWSQKEEWMIDDQSRHPTEIYNGYGKWVGHLYAEA